jgi:hypothetical protein
MTALTVRQALITVLTAATTPGTQANPVANTYTQVPDAIAFEQTPALICPPPARHLSPHSIGREHHTYEEDVDLELEYLDSPIDGDSQLDRLAEVEAWLEQALDNLLRNPKGEIAGEPSWQHLKKIDTRIEPPLEDKGQVFYALHICVGLKGLLIRT